MKTFTTYAEKKAKQFLNLLQGYTKGIRFTAILILLLMGVNNAWAASEGSSWYDWASSENVYFDNTNSSYSNVSMLIGRQWTYDSDGVGSSGVNFTKVANTNNLYHAATTWSHYNTLLFMDAKDWGWEGNKVTQRYSYASNYTNTNNVNINGTELFYAASSTKGATLNHQDLSDYAALNSQQTIQSVVDGTVANSKATISITSYKMTAHKTTTEQTAILGTGANVSYITAARTATTTLEVGTIEAGYQFDGWYTAATGGTQLSKEKTYTYYPTAATTVYARFSEIKYTVTVKNDGHGTTTPSGAQSNVGQVTGLSIKATPAANYEFVNWTITSGSGSFGSATSASTTFKPTSAATIQANFRSTATYSLTVIAGEGIESVTGSKDPVVLGNSYAITATPKTGYTFSTWTANPAANATFGSATTANTTVTVKNGSVTVTASATENMSTLTTSNKYDAGDPSYTIPSATESKIGITTTATVTATAAGNGYTFTGWTLTNCTRTDGGAVDATSITVRSNGDGKAATVVANYKEDLQTTKWYISGNGNGSGNDLTPGSPFTGWATNGIQMFKKSGHSTEEIYYCTITANTIASSDDHFPFKVYNATTSKYWGNSGYWVTKENNSPTLSSSSGYNMKFRPYLVGTYEFKLDATNASSPVLTVTWPVYNQLRISAANPADATNTGEFDMTGSGTYTVTRSLKANTTYTFKIVYNSDWYGANSGNLTRASATKTLSTSGGDLTIKTDFAGNYTFTFNSSTKALTVTYPTAYTVTYDVGTNKGTDAVTTNPTITSGDLVLASTSITFSKGATKAGYKWKNWNSKADGTGTNLGTGETYTSTNRTAGIDVYACYDLITYNITYNLDGGTGATNTTYNVESATITLPTAPTKTGYTFAGWYDNANLTGNEVTQVAKGSTGDKAFWAKWTPNTYNITYKDQGGSNFSGSHASGYPTEHTYGTATTLSTATKAGYTFGGWHTDQECTQKVTSLGATAYTAAITLYAKWTANTYTITLDQEGAAVKGDASATATYDAALPQLKQVPTAQNGYAFMGYWDENDGDGNQYYNADGTSAANWDKDEDATLYAYFKKAEISEITLNKAILDPVPAGGSGSVTATATVAPEPVGDVIICWQLLYSNGDPVVGHDPAVDGNSATFSIAGLETGHYMIRATLRTGTSCDGGIELHTLDQSFTIAANFTVTVRYTCDGKTIAAPTKHTGHATNPTEITAPEIGGYDFKEWVLGDGIYSTSTLTDRTIKYTATYDGYLTATYQKKKLIFLDVSKLPNKAQWTAPHIYLYKEGGYWNSEKGAGSKSGGNFITYAEMTAVPGTTDIWYYEYANVANFGGVVAFTSIKRENQENFNGCEAIYRSDFTSGTPMFVPSTEQEPEVKNSTPYYNKGYWVKYMDGTGYELRIFNQIEGDGTKEVMSVPLEFTTSEKMPMSVTVDLEAGHTYGFKIYRADDKWYGNTGTMTNNNHTKWAFTEKYWDKEEEKTTPNCGLTTGVSGNYTFTLIYDESSTNKNDFEYRVTVDYPASVGDYRIIYKDNNEINWSGNPKPAGWFHPSRIIKKAKDAKDIVSFFIDPKASPTIQYQSIKSVANNGTVTWNTPVELQWPEEIQEAGVYNLIVTQTDSEIRLEAVEPYTGNFYIRVDAADGKWYDYKTNPDNLMTYSAFSESEANSFGDKFSHYKTKWCPRGTNVKFVIANDYSLCISDTLARDLVKASGEDGEDYMTEGGELYIQPNTDDPTYDRYSANIRFMWNRKTNKISRAYLASSSNDSRQFLVLKGCRELKDENGKDLSGQGDNHGERCALLQDTQDWIYERTFMVQPRTRVKLYACYANTTVSPAKAQYFRGAYDGGNCGSAENSVQILGGTGDEWEKIRVIYDFKTNRLIGAWVPSGEISEDQEIAADVMIMRNHQEDATCITLAEGKSLTEVKTVYGALRFNRWTLNNKDANTHQALSIEDQKTIYERALFFISFPFDVHLSDAFGLGTYGTHWVISTYNGKRRAERGYFAEDCINEDCTNWDYIWDPTDFVMKANEGYLLSLDLELMKDDDNSFWPNNINYRELLFPSQVELDTITKTNYTMPKLGSEYECKINLNTTGKEPEKDRTVKDSYWRCIGVPSFADYSGLLKDGSDNDITWQPAGGSLPFLYEWNVINNNLVVRSATNYRFRPTFAYLIQNGGEINWTLVSTKPNPIIARERSEATSNYEWKIALLRNGNTEDQTFVRVTDDETVTAAFDFNQDLAKEFNYGANIYTLVGYERLAANSLPMNDSTTIIPLGVSAQEAGDYTITMPEGVESIGITLVDTETGTRTNLSAGMEYTFTLNRGTYDSRLYLEISPIEKTPTDLEYVDEATRNQSIRKFIIDGKLYLQKDGMLYDAQGKLVR